MSACVVHPAGVEAGQALGPALAGVGRHLVQGPVGPGHDHPVLQLDGAGSAASSVIEQLVYGSVLIRT